MKPYRTSRDFIIFVHTNSTVKTISHAINMPMRKPKLILILITLAVILLSGCSTIRSIGKIPSKERRAEFAVKYPNFINNEFRNLYDASDSLIYVDTTRIRKEIKMRKFTKRPKLSQPIPSVKTNLKDITFNRPTITWFGHSSYLIQSQGFNILVDPLLTDYASPIWYFNRSMPGSYVYKIKDLPPIDVLLITHDHYDHLDCHTIRKLRKKNTHAVVPVGVGSFLKQWNWKSGHMQEVYWGDTVDLAPGIRLISTPSQHRSGRWLKKNQTLWTSYVLEIHGYRIFIGGDSGYNKHFKDIGDTYGPFDLAILENGQYNLDWAKNHSFPEQTVHTAQDLRTRMVLPVHWARFAAAYHTWNEPIKELLPLMDDAGILVTIPLIGEPYTIGDPPKTEVWWDFE
ncbi:MBL fold metallo-hydrolase [Bacteroides sp. 51]|nr:MBL fold metallo-hydrolase [Bacteroides sp. 51]